MNKPVNGSETFGRPAMNHAEKRLADTAVRLKQLYTAAVYDIMDAMGLPNQCLDLGIKPLDRGMRIAGPAFTIACAADARVDWEYDNDEVKRFTFFRRMYRGCVVVVSSGGENRAGHWGELMSMSAQARGAAGVIVDGGVRDGNILLGMQDWPVFTRYLSPIESRGRTRIRAIEEPIAVAGSLTSQVRIVPGDWIFGDMDGVVVIPAKNVEEVARRAEDMGGIEDLARAEIRNGADVTAVFEKYGVL
jgi:4-hydroxy-4-methyl-2-oxoglutarate aldolase